MYNGKVLGRGLSSLLEDDMPKMVNSTNLVTMLDSSKIIANPKQPRKIFDQEKLKELVDSIVANGVLQPIIVNQASDDKYIIIAGERRYRASQLAGLKSIPAIIRKLQDREVLELSLIENIQRADLSVVEEAGAYKRLIEDFGYSQVQVAESVGKSRSHVANILRLNNLPETVKDMINSGRLTMGHARCLIGLEDAEELAQKIVEHDLNVRQVEDLVRSRNTNKKNNSNIEGLKQRNVNKQDNQDDDLVLLGYSLSEKFGVKVVVENSWNGGKIIFHYNNLEELDSVLSKIS